MKAITWSLPFVLLAVACGGNPQVEPGHESSAGQVSSGGGSGGKPPVHFGAKGNTPGCEGQGCGTGASAAAGTPNVSTCGDSHLDSNESCDDGNAQPGDGCSGICRLEFGFECPTPGKACVSTLFCGDKKPGPDEACDDGNQINGDGCSKTCTVEPGYSCDAQGNCIPSQTPAECGNGKVESGETCDDGVKPPVSNDGCDATCQQEPGWVCRAGQPCTPQESCGDGILNGSGEVCDDGNLYNFDCCSDTCKLEPNCTCTAPDPGQKPQQTCTTTLVCGDGKRDPGEACDDKNTNSGDGCSADCSNVESGYTCPTAGVACTLAKVPCGNAVFDVGEACDDGNTSGGDGCSADCKIEPGYVCTQLGAPCTTLAFCGDGATQPARGESCDDANATAGDGCSPTCRIEGGWACSTVTSPSTCNYTVACGDKKLGLGELCDDGNTVGGDGCSANCKAVETGYVCPSVGAKCRAVCGDSLIVGLEQCDDGHKCSDGSACASAVDCTGKGDGQCRGRSGDGCDDNCQFENDTVKDANGLPSYWSCPTAGAPCTRTVCGNGKTEGAEPCDDGNHNLGDGCTPFCQIEPTCIGRGACTSKCGDGIKFDAEACDDGNLRNGDGCDHTCKIEAGFTCSVPTTDPATLTLPIVYRDVDKWVSWGSPTCDPSKSTGQPDFEGFGSKGVEPGMVKFDLGANGKPALAACIASGQQTLSDCPSCQQTVLSAASFANWYLDNALINTTRVGSLLLDRGKNCKPDGTGCAAEPPATAYQFDSNFDYFDGTSCSNSAAKKVATCPDGFFPLDALKPAGTGKACSGANGMHNFHFTSEVRYWFKYDPAANSKLDFSGDDDVWVYIDKRLVVDIGGIHGRSTGTITLNANTVDSSGAKLNLTSGGVYEIAVFQAERQTCHSNYWLTLDKFSLTRSTCQSTCGDGVVAANEACDLGKDAGGKSLNTGAYGGCKADCSLAPYCGDSVTTAGSEDCDDGVNNTAYDIAGSTACAPGCKHPDYCGDATLDSSYGEICDLGAQNGQVSYGLGACTASCTPTPFCGDNLKNGTEQCDAGPQNGTPASNCDLGCRVKCGNGAVDVGEECDNGSDAQGKSLNVGGYSGCTSVCLRGPYCGDGFRNGPEACDDGKNDGSYGTCKADCSKAPYCGDGTVNGSEVCDLGAANVASGYGPSLCTTRCVPAHICGDGYLDSANGEVCDDGAGNSDTTAGACKTNCSGFIPPPASCGNGKKDGLEQCDDGANNGKDISLCDTRCQLKCGNGIKDTGEQCDDGKNDGSYGTCRPDCKLAPYCGDGTKTAPEQCDLGALNELAPYGANKCTKQCAIAPYCGDGRVQADHNETCDGQADCTSSCTQSILH